MNFLSKIRDMIAGRADGPGPRIAVFGDSHTAALISAQRYPTPKEEYKNIRIFRLRKEKSGKIVGDASLDEFCRHIRRFGPDDLVFSLVGGNQYAVVSTVREPVEFDFLTSPEDEEVASETRELVPFRAIQSYIDEGVRGSIGPVLREIRRSTSASVLHCTPPPPKADNRYIAKHFESSFEGQGLKEFGPTRPSLRQKCWSLQSESLQSLCDELGIELVIPPHRAVTPDGFLEPKYYAHDVTHANRRYGALVLNQILKIAARAERRRMAA